MAYVLFVNVLVLLMIAPVSHAAPTTSVFAQPNGPVGVSTGLDGSVFVTYDNVFSSRIAKFAANGALLADAETPGGIDLGNIGYLDTDVSGWIWDVTRNGDKFLIDPNLGLNPVLNLRQTPQDASSVYDLATGSRRDLSGQVTTGTATYRDVAVLNRGNQQDVFVTGRSSTGFWFVTRLRYASYQLQSAKVLISSSYQSDQAYAPGIAVSDQGTVLTTMPVPMGSEILLCEPNSNVKGCVTDKFVAFSADFPEDGSAPLVPFGEQRFYSRGMTTDAAGNFYVVPGLLDAGCTTDLTRLAADLRRYDCIPVSSADLGATSPKDVAISPDNNAAYITYGISGTTSSKVLKVSGVAPARDTTAPETTIDSGPSGTVNSSSARFFFSSSENGSSFQCSLDGAAFRACTSPQDYFSLSEGQHTFRVRATDASGNTDSSPASRTWTVSTTTTGLQTFQENDGRTGYANWLFYGDPSFSDGSSSYSNIAGSSAALKFDGTSVTWKTQKLPDGGITDVYLDGTKVKTFDAYSATKKYNINGYSASGLANTTHTLKLVVTGRKNATSSNNYTEIDRFVVGTTTVQERSPKVTYGPWSGTTSNKASGGAYRQSGSTQLVANLFNFTGPRVDVITAVGPTRGLATVKILINDGDGNFTNDVEAKMARFDMNAPTVQWQMIASITGLDSTKRYYLKVFSADGKKVVVDGYNAVPYQDTQSPAASTVQEGIKSQTDRAVATRE
jgi:hypothetical protein